MTQAQLDLLHRMAHQAQQADMDVGLGANVLLAVLDELARLRTDLDGCRAELAQTRRALEAERRARELAEAATTSAALKAKLKGKVE